MRRTRAAVVAVVAVVVLAVAMVAVAGVLRVGPFARGGAVTEALAVLPAGTDHLLVADRSAAAERLGLTDATGGDDGDDGEAAEASERAVREDAPWASSPLAGSVPSGGDADLRDADVAWWAIADGQEFGDTTVIGLGDDVDTDAVVAALGEAGYVGTGASTEDRPVLALELSEGAGDGAPATLPYGEVALDLDERLLVAGNPDGVFGVLDGSAESLADAGTYDDVTDGADGAELALLDTAGSLCDAALGARATPEGEAAEAARLDDLGRPETAGTFVGLDGSDDSDDATTSSRLRFDDDGAAEADAAVREDYLAATELTDVTVAVDGDVVTVDFAYPAPGPVALRQEALQRRTPLATQCPPS